MPNSPLQLAFQQSARELQQNCEAAEIAFDQFAALISRLFGRLAHIAEKVEAAIGLAALAPAASGNDLPPQSNGSP